VEASTERQTRIVRDAQNPPCRRAVVGHDFTFSMPKSASVLWADTDAHTHGENRRIGTVGELMGVDQAARCMNSAEIIGRWHGDRADADFLQNSAGRDENRDI
jgi:hypothetical protein